MDYICQYKKSIPAPLCKEIIEMFESEENKREGTTISGVQKDVKDTTDFDIPKNDTKWKSIENYLYKEMHNKIKKYLKKKKNSFTNDIIIESFMIQKYNKGSGKYTYHDDFYIENGMHRVFTFIWYLNTVIDGGHTEFWEEYKIQPEEGKLVFFPAFWCYPHCGKVPLSNDKYIITGWIYIKY